MFAIDVKLGDALLFDGSVPHGQGAIPENVETWSLFATLHEPDSFKDGFPDAVLNQSNSIYRALTKRGEIWDVPSLDHFMQYPAVLQQV